MHAVEVTIYKPDGKRAYYTEGGLYEGKKIESIEPSGTSAFPVVSLYTEDSYVEIVGFPYVVEFKKTIKGDK